jgi:DNA-binding NarL/FixJ family response regulator
VILSDRWGQLGRRLRPAVALDEQERTARPVVPAPDDEPELASEPVEQRANGVWQLVWATAATALLGVPVCSSDRLPGATIGADMGEIRVVLAEDHVLLREGISRLVSGTQGFELVGVVSDLPQLLAVVAQQRPDVVVTDIRMPPTGTDEGIRAAGWIHQNHPGTGVVVLSQYVAPGYAVALLEHGSAGLAYLLKERVGGVDELARAIRTVAAGGSVIDPRVVDELVRSRTSERHPGLSALTPRETEILAEMAQGKSNAAIAATLFVTERAVEKHTNSIFAKLGLSEEKDVNRRVKAVLVYLSQQDPVG